MKVVLAALMLAIVTLSGCAVVPVGYRGDGYRDGYSRGDGYRNGYYRGDGYRDGYNRGNDYRGSYRYAPNNGEHGQ